MATKQQWIIDAAHDFQQLFPVGTSLSSHDLGQWMINNGLITKPRTTNPTDPEWVKYVRDRNHTRGQINRYAISKAFADDDFSHVPYEIQYIGNDMYQVLDTYDDVRRLMRTLLKAADNGFGNKIRKIDRTAKFGKENNQFNPLQEQTLDTMRQDLEHTAKQLRMTLQHALLMYDRAERNFQVLAKAGITNGNPPTAPAIASPPAAGSAPTP